MSPLFGIRRQGEVAVLRPLDRAFLHTHSAEYNRILEELGAGGPLQFVVDLSGCDYLSSEGVNNIMQSWKKCFEAGKGRMAVVVPDIPLNEVRNLFEIIGISRLLGEALQKSMENALAYVAEPGKKD